MQVLLEAIRPLSVSDFHAMGDAGIFGPDERVELLDGVLVTVAPIGPAHNLALALACAYLNRVLGDAAVVCGSVSLIVGPTSELEPDIVLLRPEALRGEPRYWETSEVLLVVEVAQSSLDRDRGPKARAYGRGGVANYIVVDVAHEHLIVYRKPGPAGYEETVTRGRGERFSIDSLPDRELEVERFLPDPR